MKKFLNMCFELAEAMNPYSKWIIRIGSIIVFLVYFAAFLAAILAGNKLDYYAAMQTCAKLLDCGKECVGAVYIPAFLLELFIMMSGKQTDKTKK